MKNHRLVALTAAILLSASPLAPSVRAAHPNADGVMMHDGKMMIMKNGQAKGPMENSMTMSNGATVMGDGMVKMKDGSETHMKDGQMMMMDGQMMPDAHFFRGVVLIECGLVVARHRHVGVKGVRVAGF